MTQEQVNDLLGHKEALTFSDWWIATFQGKARLSEISKEELASCAWNAAMENDMLVRHPELRAAQGIAKSSAQQTEGRLFPAEQNKNSGLPEYGQNPPGGGLRPS